MGHQSLYFNGYNTQTISKSRYMYQLSIGVCCLILIIELLGCIYFIPIPM